MGNSRWVAMHILIYAIGFHSFLFYFWLAAFDPSSTASGMALAIIPMINFLGSMLFCTNAGWGPQADGSIVYRTGMILSILASFIFLKNCEFIVSYITSLLQVHSSPLSSLLVSSLSTSPSSLPQFPF